MGFTGEILRLRRFPRRHEGEVRERNWRGRPWGPASRISSQRGDTARVRSDPSMGGHRIRLYVAGPLGEGHSSAAK